MEKKYFKKRNNEYYIKYTKEEIYDQTNNNIDVVIFFLKELDYPYIEAEWNRCF